MITLQIADIMNKKTKDTLEKLTALAESTKEKAIKIEDFTTEGQDSDTFFLMAYGTEGYVNIKGHASVDDGICAMISILRSFPKEEQKNMLVRFFETLASEGMIEVSKAKVVVTKPIVN